jgi:hypothetical protein
MHRALVSVAALTAGLVSTATATAAVSLTLTPSTVEQGHVVVITGSAGDCAAGNTVFIISRAFVHTHDFAGVPAVLAKVKADHSFRTSTRIPTGKKAVLFRVTARCGGGNLGVLRHLILRR